MLVPRRAKGFRLEARQYHDAGFAPMPLAPRPPVPAVCGWEQFCDSMPVSSLQAILDDERLVDAGLGLVLGTRHGSLRLAAVAVYDEELIPAVTAALGETPCAVQGPRGLTIFALAEPEQGGRRFRRRGLDGRRRGKAVVELLARGAYVVIPPTENPIGPPYAWVGQPLLEVGVDALPRVTAATLDEIQAVVDGADEPFRVLNALGGDGVDELCKAAVEALLKRRWPDDAIVSRVQRAREEARRRAGTIVENPSADAARIQGWIERTRRARAGPDEVTRRWLEARAERPRTAEERRCWWTRSSVAYQDCEAWAEAEGYPVPHEVAWGTTLTRLGIKSAVRKVGGRSTRLRNLRLRAQLEPPL